MRFAVAVHGTRGDVEPCAAVALELRRRGHDIAMAVPPDLVGFVESAGLPAVAYGPHAQLQMEEDFFQQFWSARTWGNFVQSAREYVTRGWAAMNTVVTELAEGADLVLTGTTYQEVAANVAEHYGVPFAGLHYFPVRANGHLWPLLPSPLNYAVVTAFSWAHWRIIAEADAAQRSELYLSPIIGPSYRQHLQRGALEIQAYDPILFHGLSDEWRRRRPFVGGLTLGLATAADPDIDSWLSAGSPPIYFGFGSMPLKSPHAMISIVSEACQLLGQRALISCPSVSDAQLPALPSHIKIVGAVNHSAVFPRCRAVVHHGGAGTTTAALRAGVPTLILWFGADQPIWAGQVKHLGVGSAQRFSTVTVSALTARLRSILTPEYAARARFTSMRMTDADTSLHATADLLEETARRSAHQRGRTVQSARYFSDAGAAVQLRR
ncbi:glycosyltransferase [Mycobacteroides abscessus subsp. bolletii]|uniref:glycosyltransferase n=1 Tax=Mycobacteroides abscessus TaxID=36809 RepID=UPI0009A8D3B6|nr:glycosyltransferase [Mycobacteroides abscessus]SKG68291.1 glycosyltransferase [Mycobacteroides abscessus subsp. bolletii]SLF40147.1 glycosyltransferase [Mycobacteroides abscessus subsp. bolletii]